MDAVLIFSLVAALREEPLTIDNLKVHLASEFGSEFPGKAVFDHWQGDPAALLPLDVIIANYIKALISKEHLEPSNVWALGLRTFEKLQYSPFKGAGLSFLASWLHRQWSRILDEESFRLSQLAVSRPALERILKQNSSHSVFVASLLLEASRAVGQKLAPDYVDRLTKLAKK